MLTVGTAKGAVTRGERLVVGASGSGFGAGSFDGGTSRSTCLGDSAWFCPGKALAKAQYAVSTNMLIAAADAAMPLHGEGGFGLYSAMAGLYALTSAIISRWR